MSQTNRFTYTPLIWCYLEWSVLAIAALSVVLTDWIAPQPGTVLLPLASIAAISLLPLRDRTQAAVFANFALPDDWWQAQTTVLLKHRGHVSGSSPLPKRENQ